MPAHVKDKDRVTLWQRQIRHGEWCRRFNYWADIYSSRVLGWLADQRGAKKFGLKTSEQGTSNSGNQGTSVAATEANAS